MSPLSLPPSLPPLPNGHLSCHLTSSLPPSLHPQWASFLSHYRRPPCATCQGDDGALRLAMPPSSPSLPPSFLSFLVMSLTFPPLPPSLPPSLPPPSLSFGLGPKHSGVAWHIHGPGYSEVGREGGREGRQEPGRTSHPLTRPSLPPSLPRFSSYISILPTHPP
jgi:hypothetical protein